MFFRGNWAESFFGTAGQRILLFWQPYRQNNKGAGQGARQGVAVDAARLVVNEGWRVACGLFCKQHDSPMLATGRNTIRFISIVDTTNTDSAIETHNFICVGTLPNPSRGVAKKSIAILTATNITVYIH
ncbi:hypothetical protein A9Q81_27875 [Gammaproteobacteria bacterium 42_54_T18]|nr:hypothetical protein A9Q81_27875 [Gammaproteobacteria bacterium 42_54_T18]